MIPLSVVKETVPVVEPAKIESLKSIPVLDFDVQSMALAEKEIPWDQIETELLSGKAWRSSRALSEKLKCDTIFLNKFLKENKDIVSRPAKEEGVVFYALKARIEKEEKVQQRKIVTADDRYCLAKMSVVMQNLEALVKKHGMKVNEINENAFNYLMRAKQNLEACMYSISFACDVDLDKV